jgi:hypothetical protein
MQANMSFPFRKFQALLLPKCCPRCYPPRIVIILQGLLLSSKDCCYPPRIVVILQGLLSSSEDHRNSLSLYSSNSSHSSMSDGGGVVCKRHSSPPEEEGTSLVGCSRLSMSRRARTHSYSAGENILCTLRSRYTINSNAPPSIILSVFFHPLNIIPDSGGMMQYHYWQSS